MHAKQRLLPLKSNFKIKFTFKLSYAFITKKS